MGPGSEFMSKLSNESLRTLLDLRCESNLVDFKIKLDTRDTLAFLNLVKDIAAIANSGGGYIIIGVSCKDQAFQVHGVDDSTFLEDQTNLAQRINAYCSPAVHFNFRKATVQWEGKPTDICGIYVERATWPIMFTKSGETGLPKERVFTKHDVYIRQNAGNLPAAFYQVEALFRARGIDQARKEAAKLLGVQVQSLTSREEKKPANILHKLPHETYSKFVGRDDHIEALLEFFNNPNRRVVTIDGIGGVGKTALAREFAGRLDRGQLRPNDPPELILWLSAKIKELASTGPRDLQPDPTSEIYQQICKIVVPQGHEEIENPRREALSILAEAPSLIILDNLEGLDGSSIEAITRIVVNEFPPHLVKVIFTTRHLAVQEGGTIRVEKLSMRDAITMIEYELQLRHLSLSEAEKEKLIAKTGRIPLAIKYVIGRLELVHDIPQLIEHVVRDEVLLEFIFRETFNILSEDEKKVLFATSLEDGVNLKTLQAATGLANPIIEAAILKLRNVSFVDYDARGPSYSMSPLTRGFAWQELNKNLQLNLDLQNRLKRHKDILRWTTAAATLSADMEDALRLCKHATALMLKGDYQQADEQFDRAEEFSEALAYVLTARGDACYDSGRLREALKAYLRFDSLGRAGEARLNYRIGWLLMNVGRPDVNRALLYCRRAVQQEPENPVFLKLFGDLAVSLGHDEGEAFLKKALYEHPRGPHLRIHNADIYVTLAEVALQNKKFKRDAEAYISKAEELDPENKRVIALKKKMENPEVMKEIAAEIKLKKQSRKKKSR